MNALEAFSKFVNNALLPNRAARLAALASRPKGQSKILDYLDHGFEMDIDPKAIPAKLERSAACFAFHRSLGFGAAFSTVEEARDRLGQDDGWLIVLADGSGAIHRPEARWNHEQEITIVSARGGKKRNRNGVVQRRKSGSSAVRNGTLKKFGSIQAGDSLRGRSGSLTPSA